MSEVQLVIIIPASNEEHYILSCLKSITNQVSDTKFLTIVSANACTDGTVDLANSCSDLFSSQGHKLHVLCSPEPGKAHALNRAEKAIPPEYKELPRLFLDADVTCDSNLLAQLLDALDSSAPRFATGTISVSEAQSRVTRAYARIWCRLPFVSEGVTGAGLFAVNSAGRKRWGKFPQIISDDTFVRLNFSPEERIGVSARYHWPMVEGLRALIKVRRRQDQGVREVYSLYPHLIGKEGKRTVHKTELFKLALTMPIDFLLYALVHILTRMSRSSDDWARGR